MIKYTIFYLTYTFYVVLALDVRDSAFGVMEMDTQEVPDGPLMLLDHVRLRRGSGKVKVEKRKQNKQNSTTTTEGPFSTLRRCECSSGVCKCCTGPVLDLFNQKACLKITYHPTDFAFDLVMSMNDRVLYENSVSGKSPKPICINGPRFTNFKVCARMYNVFFPGRNVHFCLSMYGQWGDSELFNMSFDCLRMGANGIVKLKPEDEGGISPGTYGPQDGVDAIIHSGYDDIEDYNENVVKSLFEIFDYDD